jgi:hypothetical protein
MPQPSRALQAVVTKGQEVEAGGAHLSKITKGGAASVIYGAGNNQRWASPRTFHGISVGGSVTSKRDLQQRSTDFAAPPDFLF